MSKIEFNNKELNKIIKKSENFIGELDRDSRTNLLDIAKKLAEKERGRLPKDTGALQSSWGAKATKTGRGTKINIGIVKPIRNTKNNWYTYSYASILERKKAYIPRASLDYKFEKEAEIWIEKQFNKLDE